MAVTYIDQGDGGWMTRDYTMDPSDLARMRAGVDISGAPRVPMFNGFNGEVADQARVNATASQATLLSGQQQQQQNAASSAVLDANRMVQMAQTPLNYSSDASLYASQRVRTALIPNGVALYDALSGGTNSGNSDLAPVVGPDGVERYRQNYTGTPIVTSQNGTVGSDLPGSKKGGPGLDVDFINDPRFRTLMAMNPNNAKQFYTAVKGRDYDTDLAASQALLQTQNTNQLALGNEVAKVATTATQDNKEQGVYKGDIVKRVIGQPLVPGQAPPVTEVPLTDAEAKAYGVVRDPVSGRQVGFLPNSPAHRALGMNTIGDDRMALQAADARAAALHAKNNGTANSATQTVPTTTPTDPTPTLMDKILAGRSNNINTVHSFLTDPIGTIQRGGGDPTKYVSPADIARLRATPAGDINQGTHWYDNLPSFDSVMAEIGGN